MWCEYASVTTAENFILSALTVKGTSRIVNAACEPHVQEMCSFLELLGARIVGKGTSMVSVEGGTKLGGADYTFTDDFHEIATFLALSAVTGGDIRVRNRHPEHFALIDRTFANDRCCACTTVSALWSIFRSSSINAPVRLRRFGPPTRRANSQTSQSQ
jgi:UDP-N-acetylglucosamine 1-carboxyvinyltransferase